jgi:hypothetical protein
VPARLGMRGSDSSILVLKTLTVSATNRAPPPARPADRPLTTQSPPPPPRAPCPHSLTCAIVVRHGGDRSILVLVHVPRGDINSRGPVILRLQQQGGRGGGRLSLGVKRRGPVACRLQPQGKGGGAVGHQSLSTSRNEQKVCITQGGIKSRGHSPQAAATSAGCRGEAESSVSKSAS